MTGSPPQRIGRYEILVELGQGAMGVVYKARDPQLDRLVAIKTLRRDLGLSPERYLEMRRRFYQEATAAGRLSHSNVVAVYDVVEIDETPYIVTEYLAGRTLADLIMTEGPLRLERAVDVISQVCWALEYAHGHGVVHRDIKPGNIVVTADGQAKVTDFGIARIVGADFTRTGTMLGTPAYMSPEQLKGHVVDGRSDLFSLGVVLYEALTGVNPFRGDDLPAVLYQVAHVDPAPVRERNPEVPAGLEAVVARALAKDPERRYPGARAFAEALAGAPGERAGGKASSRLRLRARSVAALIGAACLLVVSFGTWALFGRGPDRGSAGGPGGADATSPFAASPREPETPSLNSPRPVGSIAVTTDPAVEVFVDGTFKGRAGKSPFIIEGVRVGPRLVTLRDGTREQELRGTVRQKETWSVSYSFRDDGGPASQAKGWDSEKALQEARERFREVEDKLNEGSREAQKTFEEVQEKFKEGTQEAVEKLRGVLGELGPGEPERTSEAPTRPTSGDNPR